MIMKRNKTLLLFILVFSLLTAQVEKKNYVFFKDTNPVQLDWVGNHTDNVTTLHFRTPVDGLDPVDLKLHLIPENMKGYRFVDQSGKDRPEDRIIAGNGTSEFNHRGINYQVYQAPNNKMPIVPHTQGEYNVELYNLQLAIDYNLPINLIWDDFNPHSNNLKSFNS